MPGLLFLLLIQNGQMILGCQNQGLILPAAQFSSALPPLRAELHRRAARFYYCTRGTHGEGGFQSRGVAGAQNTLLYKGHDSR